MMMQTWLQDLKIVRVSRVVNSMFLVEGVGQTKTSWRGLLTGLDNP